MTTLIIGGTGNTGSALAKLLHSQNKPVLVTSRSGKAHEPFKAVVFDWFDPSTFENPFIEDSSIDRVYIVIPRASPDALKIVKPFMELAISKNVKKYVLLGTLVTTPGGPFGGDIYQYLIDTGVDYVVLRPTWFMQNFSLEYLKAIKDENHFFTVAEGGRTPFVSTDDVAQAAFDALTTDQPARNAPYILGPELLSYDEASQAAELFSSILGRKITHKRIPAEERKAILLGWGIPKPFVDALVEAEVAMSNGAEEKLFRDTQELKYIGKITLKEYIDQNVSIWN